MSTVKEAWSTAGYPLSESLRAATYDLLPTDEADQLVRHRGLLEAEQKRLKDELRRTELARRKAATDQSSTQQSAEEAEFRRLVAEMSVLGFTHSNELSQYIEANQLGHRYKHISGILEMEMDGDVWDFHGGFPRHIYARLCQALGLRNQGSRAVPRKFTRYKDLLDL